MKSPRTSSLASRCVRLPLVLAACLCTLTGWAGPKAGDAFPDLGAYGLEGKVPDLKDKVVLVDFWASWCGPCKKSFPVMAELHEKFGARGFLVVAVGLDEKAGDLQAFLKKAKPPFPTLHDPKGKLAEALGVETMPTSFLLGPDGRIRAVHSGFEGESTRRKYVEEIETALKAAGH